MLIFVTKANIIQQLDGVKSNTIFHADGLWSSTKHFNGFFSKCLAGESNYNIQYAATSRSEKGKY